MRALDRKLRRDLVHLRGQVVTIALVVACGIAAFVASLSTYDSLQLSQSETYAEGRFADAFATVERAPRALAARLAEIAGVATVETRLVREVTLDLPGVGMPVIARLVSHDGSDRPGLNRLHLRRGRLVDPDRPDEVVVSEAFAAAHGLGPGDGVPAIINGRRDVLQIVGIALSPEFIFAVRGGEAIPDDRRFGVFWMNRDGLEAAFNMEGAFNDVLFTLSPAASRPAVYAEIDRLLEPYGGRGAYGRDQQTSHRFLSDEILQQRMMATTIPPVFLAVAAVLVNIVLGRIVATQREQIAALKAIGYDNGPIVAHYLKMAIVIVGIGSVAGIALGVGLGRLMTGNYTQFFRLPVLTYRVQPWVPLLAVFISFAAAAAGAAGAVRRVAALAPAEAMRPPAPRVYRRAPIERLWPIRILPVRMLMSLRLLIGQPWRTAITIGAVALAMPIIVLGLFWRDALDYMVETQFFAVERADVIVSFVDPMGGQVRHELSRLPGTFDVEGMRAVSVRLRAGHRTYRTAILGIEPAARLRRLLDATGRVVAPPPDGVMLTDRLAGRLGVAVGDRVTVEVLEGNRRQRDVAVTGLVDDLIGLSAYMEIGALNRLMGEGAVISAAALAVDRGGEAALFARLREMPRIATVTVRREAMQTFLATTATFVLVFSAVLCSFAAAIAIGVVYNNARIALAERSWDLATLRVLGFTRREVSAILLGGLVVELALAVPLGSWLSFRFVDVLLRLTETEMFRIPPVISTRTYLAAAAITLLAGAASALIVRQRIDHLDLVGVLKARE